MTARTAAIGIAVSTLAAACSMILTQPPPTRTPRPTVTPTLGVTPTGVLFFPSTAVLDFPDPTAVEAGPTLLAGNPTLTPRLTARPAAGQPLAITNVLLVKVERDPARANGALASLQVVYSGGRAPYRIHHDETLQAQNPFRVLTDCNGTLVHTIRLTSGDGQVVRKQYYLSPIECPP
jgi:hypothetical protein